MLIDSALLPKTTTVSPIYPHLRRWCASSHTKISFFPKRRVPTVFHNKISSSSFVRICTDNRHCMICIGRGTILNDTRSVPGKTRCINTNLTRTIFLNGCNNFGGITPGAKRYKSPALYTGRRKSRFLRQFTRRRPISASNAFAGWTWPIGWFCRQIALFVVAVCCTIWCKQLFPEEIASTVVGVSGL